MDIFEILKEKEQESNREKKFYIYYDPSSGQILHLRNYLEEEESHPFIIISESELDISIENFRIREYLVLEKKKKMKLTKIDTKSVNRSSENERIYQIPKSTIKNRNEINKNEYEIVIEQNNKDKVFRLNLSSEAKSNFLPQESLRTLSLNIYVTAENDPHILYQTLEFKLEDLLDHAYHTISFNEFNGERCNLFSRKYFQTYLHADIR